MILSLIFGTDRIGGIYGQKAIQILALFLSNRHTHTHTNTKTQNSSHLEKKLNSLKSFVQILNVKHRDFV